MTFKNFRINTIFYLLSISITIGFIIYLFISTRNYFSIALLLLLLGYLVYLLFYYIDRTNQDLIRLFEAIHYADFTLSFPNNKRGGSFKKLYESFEVVINNFKILKSEKEEYARLLQNIIEHIPIGIIVYTENGNVILSNKSVKKMLSKNEMNNVNVLENISLPLTKFLLSNNNKELINLSENNLQLAAHLTSFILKERKLKLVSFQNIHQELEQKEIESWENLIRILTHEIMNSITPITSLASTANEIIKKNINSEDLKEDLQLAIQTIENRSKGLLHFVDSYRKVSRLPQPKLQSINLEELFKEIKNLMQTDGTDLIQFKNEDPSLLLNADKEMMEQMMINLIQNSKEAIVNVPDPTIIIKAFRDNQYKINIEVQDNGSGIEEELMDKIFIPFFSSKQKGSGIGLSLCKQIMVAHGGSIEVKSSPGITQFICKF